jgi:hypothetical protein
MMLSREPIALAAICALAALGSLAGALYVLIAGDMGLDGLFLLIVCITFAAAFGLVTARTLRKGHLRELLSAGQSKASAPATDPKTDANAKAQKEGDMAEHSEKTAREA